MGLLQQGERAIAFTLQDYLGNSVSLNDYTDKKVLLSFFRGASCPFCNMRVRELIKRYHEFEKNHIHLIAFFADSREEIASYAGKQKPPFPIIPDPSLAFYKRYDVESSHLGMLRAMLQPLKMFKVITSGFFSMKAINDRPLIPADFLIDEDQTIRRVCYGTDFGDHLPIEEILSWKSKGTG